MATSPTAMATTKMMITIKTTAAIVLVDVVMTALVIVVFGVPFHDCKRQPQIETVASEYQNQWNSCA